MKFFIFAVAWTKPNPWSIILIFYTGKKRNNNIFKPMRLSNLLMEVLQTTQKYRTPNEIRSLMAEYKKKLKVNFQFEQLFNWN